MLAFYKQMLNTFLPWLVVSIFAHGLLVYFLIPNSNPGVQSQSFFHVSLLGFSQTKAAEGEGLSTDPKPETAKVENNQSIQPRQSAKADEEPKLKTPRKSANAITKAQKPQAFPLAKHIAGEPDNYQNSILGESNGAVVNGAVPGGIYEIFEIDIKPQVVYQIPPQYPIFAKRQGIEGWVEIKFIINQQGLMEQETVARAEPQGIFDQAALTSLRQWKFIPGQKNGKPVKTKVVQIIRFNLT